MEVYTPIPDDVYGPSTRGHWVVGAFVLVIAAGLAVTVAWRFDPQPSHRNFGTVETRFGTAGVLCGGDTAPACGEATGIAFAKCSPEVRAYFGDDRPAGTHDERARALLGARPPTGDHWYFLCGWSPLIRGGPAHLHAD